MGTQYNTQPTQDHEGRWYNSLAEMCTAYNMGSDTYLVRIKRGWSVKKALTTPVRLRSDNSVEPVDHLGNTYTSVAEMCNNYKISVGTFLKRYKQLHWTLEKSLTTPVRYRSDYHK